MDKTILTVHKGEQDVRRGSDPEGKQPGRDQGETSTKAVLNMDLNETEDFATGGRPTSKVEGLKAARQESKKTGVRESVLKRASAMGREVGASVSPKGGTADSKTFVPREGSSGHRAWLTPHSGLSPAERSIEGVHMIATKIQVREKPSVESLKGVTSKAAPTESTSFNNTINPARQRLGGKTLVVHSDMGQYQLYMQMKQMSALSEAMALDYTVSTPKESAVSARNASSAGRRQKSFFQAVAAKMQEVFGGKASIEDYDDYTMQCKNLGHQQQCSTHGPEPVFTTPRSLGVVTLTSTHREREQKWLLARGARSNKVGMQLQHVKGGSRGHSRAQTGTGNPRAAKSLLKLASGNKTQVQSPVSNQNLRENQHAALTPMGGSLYQQSFLPAQRLIQQQMFIQLQERSFLRKSFHQAGAAKNTQGESAEQRKP